MVCKFEETTLDPGWKKKNREHRLAYKSLEEGKNFPFNPFFYDSAHNTLTHKQTNTSLRTHLRSQIHRKWVEIYFALGVELLLDFLMEILATSQQIYKY